MSSRSLATTSSVLRLVVGLAFSSSHSLLMAVLTLDSMFVGRLAEPEILLADEAAHGVPLPPGAGHGGRRLHEHWQRGSAAAASSEHSVIRLTGPVATTCGWRAAS